MKTKRFQVNGPLRGHVCSVAGRRGLSTYQRYVRLMANTVGVPDECPEGARVEVVIWWKRRARIDSENVGKAIVDAMWTRDRRCLEVHYRAHERLSTDEHAIVVVTVL